MDSSILPGVKTLTIFLPLFCSSLLICGCNESAESGAPESTAAVWIQQASAIAQKIPVEIHGVERDRALAKSAVTAVELGVADQCRAILPTITSWHRAELTARLARSCYLKGHISEGDELRGAAETLLQKESYENWQISRIRLALEQAGHAKGEKTDASVIAKVESADQARLLPELVQANLAQTNLVEMLTRLEATTNQVLDIDTAAGTVDTFLVLYKKSQQSESPAIKELRVRMLAGVEAAFIGLHAAIACEKLVDFCNAALAAGDLEFAAQLSGMVGERLPAVRTDMRLPVQLRYAEFLIKAGNTEQAVAQVDAVEEVIGAESVVFSDRPMLLARCGVVCQSAGDLRRAQLFFRQAVIGLEALTNARPRAVTAVDIALLFARAAVDMPPILAAMQQLNHGLGDPW